MKPFKINLDYQHDSYEEIQVSQLDTVKLECTITDNWEVADLIGATIQMQIGKPDGRYVIQTGNITTVGNIVNITLDEQATVVESKDKPTELTLIISKSGERKGFWIIKLKVKRTAISEKVESVSAVPIIKELEGKITEGATIKNSLVAEITKGTTLKTDLTTKITEGTTLKTDLTAKVTEGTTLKSALATQLTTGGTLKTDLTTKITEGTTVKTDLTTKITEGNTVKTNIEKLIADGGVVKTTGGTITGTLTATNLQVGGKDVYHTGRKPTPTDIGALPISGGTLAGGLTATGFNVGSFPIVERGSNANGTFIKYYDGTLICYQVKSFGNSPFTTKGAEACYTSPDSNQDFTFAKPFTSRPAVLSNASSSGYLVSCVAGITTTVCRVRIYSNYSSTQENCQCEYMAIGKWKE